LENRVAKRIDEEIASLRKKESAKERLESLLSLIAKVAIEIDACFEMFEKEKSAREVNEKKLVDLTEEMRKLRKVFNQSDNE